MEELYDVLREALNHLMLIVAGLACSAPLSIDDDGDGYSRFDGDCDDSDPQSTIRSQDED